MAIRAIFVGMNQHLDAVIPEFSGAGATVLWIRFSDTVDGLSARLLLDGLIHHRCVMPYLKEWGSRPI